MNWTSFRPIQEEAIQYLIQTPGDLIISAPTASGKTEAAFLPVLSTMVKKENSGVKALYISPLKALINDQLNRVEQLCAHLNISVTRWHGDASNTEKKRLLKNPSGVMMTTPESLEALFQNRSTVLPVLFGQLEYILIDEIHYFLENTRGTQLRCLLNRLENLVNRDPYRIGLSATIGNPDSLKKWLNGNNPEKVRVILGTGLNKTKSGIVEMFDKPKEEEIKPEPGSNNKKAESKPKSQFVLGSVSDASSKSGWDSGANESSDERPEVVPKMNLRDERLFQYTRTGKNLVFADSKKTLETSCWKMRQIAEQKHFPDTYLIHHGSLSREIREFAEGQLKSQKNITVFCTSTLELGIDIGNVDQTLYLSVPFSVASFIQRLGRSGRKENGIQKFVFLLQSHQTQNAEDLLQEELVRCIAVIELMLAGWCEPQDPDWFDYSTVAQQILSYLGQTRGASPLRLFSAIAEIGLEKIISADDFILLLRSLKSKDLIYQQEDGIIALSEKGERVVENYHFYATFQTPSVWKVKYKDKEIGEIEGTPMHPFDKGCAILLAGRQWQVSDIRRESRIMNVIPGTNSGASPISMQEKIIHKRIHEKMKEIYKKKFIPEYLSEVAKRRLREAFETFDTIANNKESNYFLLFKGSKVVNTLALLMKLDKALSIKSDILFHYSQGRESLIEKLKKLDFSLKSPESLLNCYPDAAKELRKYDFCVPTELLNKSWFFQCMDWESTRCFCKEL